MSKRIAYWLGAAACLAILVASIVALQLDYDRRYLSSEQSVRELLYFPSPRIVKFLSAGNELMMADYLWLRMIQYYAFHLRADQNFEYLYPITDNLTDLDPKFMYPYTFGSLLLVHDARDSVNSLKLLDKAKINNPDKWEFPYMKGFILYVFLGRSDQALAEFQEASRLPEAWEGALRFAAWISQKQGRLKTSKMMWQELYDKSSSREERDVALVNIALIEIQEEIERLQWLAEKYRRLKDAWPEALEDLVAEGLLSGISPDSYGREYYWNQGESRVHNRTHDLYLIRTGKMK